jgi:molecular chaperone DnaK (HSP70)
VIEDIVGIDLGTTNSEIAIYQDARPEVLKDEQPAICSSARTRATS